MMLMAAQPEPGWTASHTSVMTGAHLKTHHIVMPTLIFGGPSQHHDPGECSIADHTSSSTSSCCHSHVGQALVKGGIKPESGLPELHMYTSYVLRLRLGLNLGWLR